MSSDVPSSDPHRGAPTGGQPDEVPAAVLAAARAAFDSRRPGALAVLTAESWDTLSGHVIGRLHFVHDAVAVRLEVDVRETSMSVSVTVHGHTDEPDGVSVQVRDGGEHRTLHTDGQGWCAPDVPVGIVRAVLAFGGEELRTSWTAPPRAAP